MREAMVGRGAVREGGLFDSGLFFRDVSGKDKEAMADARGSEEKATPEQPRGCTGDRRDGSD
jgi:hypothetical protein